MRLRHVLMAATMLAVPAAAGAQPVTGLYIGAAGGWNQPVDRERLKPRNPFFGAAAPFNNYGRTEYDSGFVGLINVGWGFGNGVRAELEGNFRQNDIDKLRSFGSSPFAGVRGYSRTWGAMANVYYDFDLANFGLGTSIVQPYVGVGVGYAWNQFHGIRGTSVRNGLTFVSNDVSDGNFAYQGILGAAIPLTQFGVTGLSLTAEYRFFGTLDQKIGSAVYTPTGAVAGTSKLRVEDLNHSVLIGLRYAFMQPPPPATVAAPAPAPAPAAQPARTYLVFFDWDRADLTARAREIIREAADNSQRMQVTRIEVAGHADRSGDAAYNQRLSLRRAEAVSAELVRDGVQRSNITVQGYGESRPLVPTADGVREPQNRRVEIVLR